MDRKVALVTGGTRGIGFACSQQLAKDGYFVIMTYQKNREAAQEALKTIKNISDGVIAQIDMNNLDDVKFLFYTIEDENKRLDVLVNNAGITADKSIFNITPALDLDEALNVNIKGPLACIHYAAKIMFTQKSGSIINISSVSATHGNPGQIIYSATKGAINSMTITAAKELSPFGIRVNAVAPGFIKTSMLDEIPEIKLKKITSQIPMGNIGDVQDVSNAISFLASDNSKYITGQILTIDGGLSL